jgi:hypothetical protein
MTWIRGAEIGSDRGEILLEEGRLKPAPTREDVEDAEGGEEGFLAALGMTWIRGAEIGSDRGEILLEEGRLKPAATAEEIGESQRRRLAALRGSGQAGATLGG